MRYVITRMIEVATAAVFHAGRREGNPGPAGDVGVALRHVAGALLVAHEDVADGAVQQRVVHRQDAAAGQPEDRVDALHLEGLDQCL